MVSTITGNWSHGQEKWRWGNIKVILFCWHAKEITVDWKNRVEVNPAVLVGKPIIKGTRISVELILDRLADGWTMEDVLASYPRVNREDVLVALSFAS